MVEFAGWELPLQYTSVIEEHKAVRHAAGLFDISHMAQARVRGDGAVLWLQSVLTNDIAVPPGCGVYSLMCNEAGGVIDDLYAFRISGDSFLLVMNASREAADLAWLRSRLIAGIGLEPIDERGALALQGPLAADVFSYLAPHALLPGKNGVAVTEIRGHNAIVARTGYTGEDGCEVFASDRDIPGIWEAVWDAGRRHGLQPCGLGARDTLRLEMAYPLYGHELTESTSPYEAGYGWTVKLDKETPFCGQAALREEKARGSRSRLAALVLEGRGIARETAQVYSGGELVGEVTSGTFSPSLERAICLARVRPYATGQLSVDIRGRREAAREVRRPFYRGNLAENSQAGPGVNTNKGEQG